MAFQKPWHQSQEASATPNKINYARYKKQEIVVFYLLHFLCPLVYAEHKTILVYK